MRSKTVIIIEMSLPDARLLNRLLLSLTGGTLAQRQMMGRVQTALQEKLS